MACAPGRQVGQALDPAGYHQRQTPQHRPGRLSARSLASARDRAAANAKAIRDGLDPILEKRRARELALRPTIPTFAEAAKRVIDDRRATWRNRKHAAQWSSTLETYAHPKIGNKPVDQVTTADILSILAPVWVAKHETATRVRQRLETIFDCVIAQGWRRDNPASRSITKALPKVRRRRKHHKALPHGQVPAAVKKARDSGADPSTKLCFEFLVLTAARSGKPAWPGGKRLTGRSCPGPYRPRG